MLQFFFFKLFELMGTNIKILRAIRLWLRCFIDHSFSVLNRETYVFENIFSLNFFLSARGQEILVAFKSLKYTYYSSKSCAWCEQSVIKQHVTAFLIKKQWCCLRGNPLSSSFFIFWMAEWVYWLFCAKELFS